MSLTLLTFVLFLLGLCNCLAKGVTQYKVSCWGGNEFGQIGVGDSMENGLPFYLDMDRFEGEVIQISAGKEFTIALDSLGNVYTWGRNDLCQNGFKSTVTEEGQKEANFEPRKVTLANKIRFVSAGADHAFALVDDTRVYVWGANERSQAKPGVTTDICTPELIDFSPYIDGEHILQIVGGGSSSYILTKSGQVYSWGDNSLGQLGLGLTTDENGQPLRAAHYPLPVRVNLEISPNVDCGTVNRIHAGLTFVHITCESNQRLVGWGDNAYYLVDGSDSSPLIVEKPTVINPTTGDRWTMTLSSVSGLDYHSVMLSGDRLVCWGDSKSGECGQVTNNPIQKPSFTPGIPMLGQIVTAGNGFTVILDRYGVVMAAGNNQNYQLGTGQIPTSGHTSDFVKVDFTTLDPKPVYNPYLMVSGIYHTCVLFGKYEVPPAEPLSFVDVYVYFLIADAIVSFLYFLIIGIMECIKH